MQLDDQLFVKSGEPQTWRAGRSLLKLGSAGIATIMLTYGCHYFWLGSAIGADVRSIRSSVTSQAQIYPPRHQAIAGSMTLFRLGIKSREAMQHRKTNHRSAVAVSPHSAPRPTFRSYVNAATIIFSAIAPQRTPGPAVKPSNTSR